MPLSPNDQEIVCDVMCKPTRTYLSEVTGITAKANPKGKASCMSEKVGPDCFLLTGLCTKSRSACEAGISIKPGAQAPGSDHKNKPEPVKRVTAGIYRLSPAVAGSDLFIGT